MEGGCGAVPDALERHVFDQPLRDAHVGKSVHLIKNNLVAGGTERENSSVRGKDVKRTQSAWRGIFEHMQLVNKEENGRDARRRGRAKAICSA